MLYKKGLSFNFLSSTNEHKLLNPPTQSQTTNPQALDSNGNRG